jgi:hypothetical protein
MSVQAAELRYALQILVTRVIEQRHAFGMTFAGVAWTAGATAGDLAYPQNRNLLTLTDEEVTGTILDIATALEATAALETAAVAVLDEAAATPITPEALLAQARAFVSAHWGHFGFSSKLKALEAQNETLYNLVQSLVRNR